jgi:hypothetical protein
VENAAIRGGLEAMKLFPNAISLVSLLKGFKAGKYFKRYALNDAVLTCCT